MMDTQKKILLNYFILELQYAKWGCVVNPWRCVPGRKKVFSRNDMNVRII
jgi:hypothetical protein